MNLSTESTKSIKWYKNKWVWLVLAGLIVITAIIDNNIEKPVEKPVENISNEAALTEIRKEPKVKEALITSANVIYVSVEDDGTRRDGYAEYLCQILKEQKSSVNWVKVVKVHSTKDPNADNAYGVLLGESHCN